MIKFFRRIRQKLLSENRFSKYLIYAIGEILLVVVGILIALQVNNWNESQKNRDKEKLILNELLSSINKDLDHYELNNNHRLQRKRNGLDSLNRYINSNKSIADSLFFKFYNDMKQDITLEYDSGAFQALNSLGLDIIKNDSLRSKINQAYSVSLPFRISFNRPEIIQTKILELEYKIHKFIPKLTADRTTRMTKVLNVENVLQNQDFYWILDMETTQYWDYMVHNRGIKEILEELKTDIEQELSK